MNTLELRAACASRLEQLQTTTGSLKVFIGLDGFVDEIIHVVDKRQNAESFERIRTISGFAERIAGAAGKGTNIEMVRERIKLGGNGPIMANAMAALGVRVSYLGSLGYPNLHPVFGPFSQKAEVVSIAEAGYTEALEFDDGKLMLGKMVQLRELTWGNIQSRYGRDQFLSKINCSDLIGFVNWTMIPYMSDLWESILTEICPHMRGPRRKIFFDLADPEKRTKDDLLRALKLIARFNEHFDVILGLNQKEGEEVRRALDLPVFETTPEGLCDLTEAIVKKIPVQTLVIHPTTYAVAWCNGKAEVVEGPYIAKPMITTGAGDHFNAGFCLGKLLGLDNAMCVLTGVASSGFYVRTAQSASVAELAGMLHFWPEKSTA